MKGFWEPESTVIPKFVGYKYGFLTWSSVTSYELWRNEAESMRIWTYTVSFAVSFQYTRMISTLRRELGIEWQYWDTKEYCFVEDVIYWVRGGLGPEIFFWVDSACWWPIRLHGTVRMLSGAVLARYGGKIPLVQLSWLCVHLWNLFILPLCLVWKITKKGDSIRKTYSRIFYWYVRISTCRVSFEK